MTYNSSYINSTYDFKYFYDTLLSLEGDNLFMVTLFLRSKTNLTVFLKYPMFLKKKENIVLPKVYFNIDETNSNSIINPDLTNGTKYNKSFIPIFYNNTSTTEVNTEVNTKITLNNDLIIGKIFDDYIDYEISSLSPYLNFNDETKKLTIKSGYNIYNNEFSNQTNFFHYWKMEFKNKSTGFTTTMIFWTFFTNSSDLVNQYLQIIGMSEPYDGQSINNFCANHILIGSHPDIFYQDNNNLKLRSNNLLQKELSYKYYTDTRHINNLLKYQIKNLNFNGISNIKPYIEKLSVSVFNNIKKSDYKKLYEKIMIYILIWNDDNGYKIIIPFLKSELENYTSYVNKNSLSIYYTTSLPQFINNNIKIFPSSLKNINSYAIYYYDKLYLEMGEIIIIDDNYFYIEGLNVFTNYYDLKLIRSGKDITFNYSGYYTIGNYLNKSNTIIPNIDYSDINTYKAI